MREAEPARRPIPGLGNRPLVLIAGALDCPAAASLRGQLILRQVPVEVGCALPDVPSRVLFVGLGREAHARLQRAAGAKRHVVLNPVRSRWATLRVLLRAGIDVPRSEPALRLTRALRAAERIGFPCVLKDNLSRRAPRLIANRTELALAWRPGARTIVQEYLFRGTHAIRVTVVAGRCAYATRHFASDGFLADGHALAEHWPDVPDAARALAVRAASTLGLGAAVITLISSGRGFAVVGVSPALWGPPADIADCLALERSADRRAEPVPRARRARLTVAVTCPDPRLRHPVWLWVPLVQAFRGAGHRVVHVHEADRRALDDARFVLVDPGRTYRASQGDADWMNELHERCAARAHYAKRVDGGRLVSITSKRDTAAITALLGIEHPRTFASAIPPDAAYPLVVKPTVSSCGRGIEIVRSPDQLPARLRESIPRAWVVQELVRSGVGHAVSLRVVTVRQAVVAAGLFYCDGPLSNLNRGGRAVPLTGVHRASRVSAAERRLLEQLDLRPDDRRPPPSALESALAVSRWYATRGVQVLGHDFVPNGRGGWCYLESNAYPGYLLFAETDGDRRRRLLSGYYRAARMLADAIAEQLGG
jgi:glutathione synthase/RimK-type ligase-like ATP-grasp enzyme